MKGNDFIVSGEVPTVYYNTLNIYLFVEWQMIPENSKLFQNGERLMYHKTPYY